MCLMGDGTTNIGAFHESLNLAAIWNLPAVYVVNNNGLGMGTTVEQSSAEPELYKRAAAYRMSSARIDGNNPETVYAAMLKALESARNGKPYLLEVMTGRMKGHSVVDPAKYRNTDEVAAVQAADPVTAYASELLKRGVLLEAELAELDAETKAAVHAAVLFAEQSPHPDVTTLFDYNYATPVPNDSQRLPGERLYPAEELPA